PCASIVTSMNTVPCWPRSCDRMGKDVSPETIFGSQVSASAVALTPCEARVAKAVSETRAVFIAISQIRCGTKACTLQPADEELWRAAGTACLRWPGARAKVATLQTCLFAMLRTGL